jgi:hypothetical protein
MCPREEGNCTGVKIFGRQIGKTLGIDPDTIAMPPPIRYQLLNESHMFSVLTLLERTLKLLFNAQGSKKHFLMIDIFSNRHSHFTPSLPFIYPKKPHQANVFHPLFCWPVSAVCHCWQQIN